MKNVLELLERTAARLPRQTAFADQQCSYDYQTVVNIAGSVGSALAANGDRNCPVAVLMERGAPCLVTLMGVLYSGNFYVVLDPEMPAERVNKILRTLQPTALICDEAHKDDPAGLDYDGKVYSAEALAAGQAQPELLQTVRRRMIDTDPAYAIFTSGSTGNPKGVVVNHRSVLAYSAWAADTFGISEKTIFGNQTPFYFSMSVTDIYATIRTGAQLHVIPKSYFSFPALLIRYLNERQVNTIYWVPSALSIVANLKVLDFMMAEHIEKVLFAGEVMPAKQLNYWRSKYPNALFANLVPMTFALFCVWFFNGIWHGASWKYVLYGLYYYILMMIGMYLRPVSDKLLHALHIAPESKGFALFQMVRTFLIVNVGMMLFRCHTISQWGQSLARIFTDFDGACLTNGTVLSLGNDWQDFLIMGIGVLVVGIVEVLQEKGHTIRSELARRPVVLRYAVFLALILGVVVFGAYGTGYETVAPIYGQF